MPEWIPPPEVKLSPEMKRQLESLDEPIKKSEAHIATFKELGMDTSALEAHLKWGKKVRETLLKQFG